MVSLPVTPADNHVTALFPDALGGTVYTWDPNSVSYSTVGTMDPGTGYWLAVGGAVSCTVSGAPLNAYTSPFTGSGWRMIGRLIRFIRLIWDFIRSYIV
jgi:hypothetical protein